MPQIATVERRHGSQVTARTDDGKSWVRDVTHMKKWEGNDIEADAGLDDQQSSDSGNDWQIEDDTKMNGMVQTSEGQNVAETLAFKPAASSTPLAEPTANRRLRLRRPPAYLKDYTEGCSLSFEEGKDVED